ncbi:hypothetical protein [Methylobrevis pamukkalensis]|uniref:Uncharacterized protein n=1 Tax=Methylobrevis pamukkalensis TaxID=1439726 RepID=A0A1E3H5I1_9HYPH|nr:hypothetical protein [Methylobrevis pamukkalensis]ODN71415.1 hypothetical protein A6302_01279 [Methylobrevis pamukkalensis]
MLFRRETANLWTLITPPTVWAMHFMVAYVLAAVVCAKTGNTADLDSVRWIIAGATAVALGLIAAAAVQAHRHWGFGDDMPPHNEPTDEDRQHFLGFATLLICGVSAIGVIFVALPALFIADCR